VSQITEDLGLLLQPRILFDSIKSVRHDFTKKIEQGSHRTPEEPRSKMKVETKAI
jgi:hypothetical protein